MPSPKLLGLTIPQRILLSLSRKPEDGDYYSTALSCSLDNALDLLSTTFPNFAGLVTGKRVLDFGCGEGRQCAALVKEYGCHVVGIEANPKTLEHAKNLAKLHKLPETSLLFISSSLDEFKNSFDIVISQNSFEHFDNPEHILQEMRGLIAPSGKILLTFGPPWFSPYGSHMDFFCRVPWINLIFSDETVYKVRSYYRSDQSKPYEGLNKMSIRKFEALIRDCEMVPEFLEYRCVWGLNFLGKLPFLRELFINKVSVILTKSQ